MSGANYNQYMKKALIAMVGDILGDVAEDGLKGEQHFYIAFRTTDKGVDIPAHLYEQFPEEMTIILQGWFDNLAVMDDRFFVTLSFGGVAQDLVIPLRSIVSFSDPSVNFALNFENGNVEAEIDPIEEEEAELIVAETVPAEPEERGKVISLDQFRKSDN